MDPMRCPLLAESGPVVPGSDHPGQDDFSYGVLEPKASGGLAFPD